MAKSKATKAEQMSAEEVENLKKASRKGRKFRMHADLSRVRHAKNQGEKIPGSILGAAAEQIKRAIKTAGWMSLLESVLLGVLGVIIVMNPEATITAISYILGGFLLVFGVYQLINYFVVRGMYDFSNNQLLGGVVAFLIGVMIIMLGAEIGSFFRIIIGIWLIYAALARMNTSIKLRVAGVRFWGYVLLVAALMLLVGVFVLFNSGAVMQIVGWAMIATAVLGAVDDVIFLYNIDQVIEGQPFKK